MREVINCGKDYCDQIVNYVLHISKYQISLTIIFKASPKHYIKVTEADLFCFNEFNSTLLFQSMLPINILLGAMNFLYKQDNDPNGKS